MKRLTAIVPIVLLALSATFAVQPAAASMVARPQLSGHVTALASNEVIVVDGHRYLVAVNSAAYKTMASLRVGDSVDLYFDGPVKNSASHVTAIVRIIATP